MLRSPHAHARIRSIDTTAAARHARRQGDRHRRRLPRSRRERAHPTDVDLALNVIARDKVLYEGHVVAAVAATTRAEAHAAADAIVVEYEVLPHVLSVDEAMAEGATLLHPNMMTKGVDPAPTEPSNVASRIVHERGELDQGFAAADVVVEQEFTTKPVHQGYIEPHAAVGDTTQDGRSTVWCSSQGHFAMRTMTAKVLGWEPSRLKVIPAEIGGGFGGKTTIYLEPLVVALSRKSGAPGEAGHEPRRGVPGHRPDVGHPHQGEDGRRQGGQAHRRRDLAGLRGRRVPRLPGRRRRHDASSPPTTSPTS